MQTDIRLKQDIIRPEFSFFIEFPFSAFELAALTIQHINKIHLPIHVLCFVHTRHITMMLFLLYYQH